MASSTAEAAAALLESVSTDAAAGGVADSFVPDDAAEPDLAPSSSSDSAAPEAHEADTDPDTQLLGLPEPEDADWLVPEPDEEPGYVPPPEDIVEPEDEYTDPETAALLKRLKAAEKKAAFHEAQNLKTARKLWAKEAGKFYPLANPESLTQATSKRAFMRAAKAEHERLLPTFKKFQETERARLKAEAGENWGVPMGAGQVPTKALEQSKRIEQARGRGLAAVFKEMLD